MALFANSMKKKLVTDVGVVGNSQFLMSCKDFDNIYLLYTLQYNPFIGINRNNYLDDF